MIIRGKGFTLIEMLVCLAVLTILASMTLPYAATIYRRADEVQLQQALRTIRSAVDAFHSACENGFIVKAQEGVSQDCYPKTLQAMVVGVESAEADGGQRYFLRRMPADPFSGEEDVEDQWEVRGYRDTPDGVWSGDDVYDVRVQHDQVSLDGSSYREW